MQWVLFLVLKAKDGKGKITEQIVYIIKLHLTHIVPIARRTQTNRSTATSFCLEAVHQQ
jgi:hypothetical protein